MTANTFHSSALACSRLRRRTLANDNHGHRHRPARARREPARREHARHGILTEAWSPLGQGELLHDETISRIASGHDRTPAQVILRWHIQLGNVVIPKSVTPERIEENLQVFDFELSDDDMRAIAQLDSGDGRIGPDPSTFG